MIGKTVSHYRVLSKLRGVGLGVFDKTENAILKQACGVQVTQNPTFLTILMIF